MPGKAAVVGVSDKPLKVLTKRSVSRSEAPMWIQRARIIRRAHAGESNAMIAEAVGLNRTDVGQWRCRGRDTQEPRAALELREPQRLTEAIRETLREAPRSGCGGTFTAEPVTRIQALAGEQPSVSGRPITPGTHGELPDEILQRGIVPTISLSPVGTLLRKSALLWIKTAAPSQ